MEQIHGTVKAWMTSGDDIRVLERDPSSLAASLGYTSSETDMSAHGWLPIGEAEITITIKSRDDVITAQIQTLRKMQESVRAEAEKKANDYEQKIQSLLAITCEAA